MYDTFRRRKISKHERRFLLDMRPRVCYAPWGKSDERSGYDARI